MQIIKSYIYYSVIYTSPPAPEAPSVQASLIVVDNSGVATEAEITWTNGNGSNRIVVIYPTAVYTNPVDGTTYTADTVYGSGDAVGLGYVIYSGTGSSVTVTGLSQGTSYYVKVFEANDTLYNVTDSTDNPETFETQMTFAQRVVADGGSFEAQSCMDSVLASMGAFSGSASMGLTANGFKTGKLYAYTPSNGSGDLTFTRSTTGWRKNSAVLQEMPIDVPRFDYVGATCPNLLLEPARTNLLLRGDDISNASWSKTNATTAFAFDVSTLPNVRGANGIWVDGDYTYVVAYGGDALSIFYNVDKYNPVFVGKVTVGAGPIGVVVVGNIAFVTCNTGNCVNLVDISNKTSPTIVYTLNNGSGGVNLNGPWNAVFDGTYFYVGTNTAIQVLQYNPSTPSLTVLGSISANVVTNLRVIGNYIYYVSFTGDLFGIINATNKSSLVQAGTIAHLSGGALLDMAHDVVMTADGNTAFVCARASNTINVFNTSNKSSISVISVFTDNTNLIGVESMVLDETKNRIYCVNLTGDDFVIVNSSNTASLSIVSQINTNLDGANKCYVSGNYAHIACLDGSLYVIVDITNDTAPIVRSIINDSNIVKVLETVTNATHQAAQPVTKAASSLPYIASIVVKGGLGRDYICLQVDDGTNGQGRFFNITNGTLGGIRTIGSGFTIIDSQIIDLGNDGYLCMVRCSSSTAATISVRVLLSTDGTTISYAGNTSLGFYMRKATMIQSASPLTESFITTFGSSVQRTADTITPKIGATALIGQTQGTLFFWIKRTWADSVSKAISLSDGTANNRIIIDFTSGNAINALVVSGGVTQATITNASFANLTEYKVAVTYQSNKAALFVNGTKIGEDLTVTVPACSRIGFDSGAGSNPFYGNVQAFALSQTALSDADAQTLTTV